MGLPRALLPLLCLWLAACGAVPADGPSARAILTPAPDAAYRLVPLTASVTALLAEGPGETGMALPPPVPVALGPGDRVEIRIWEPSDEGLFATAGQRETLLEGEIGEDGTLFVPYVGAVAAAGSTAAELRARLADGFRGLAVDPQVQVRRTGGSGQSIVVTGDVRAPGRIDIDAGGLAIPEAVALAGGAAAPHHETEVLLTRGGQTHVRRLAALAREPEGATALRPGDRIELRHRPQSFTVFGALGDTRHLPFEAETLSLAEAIARARGLSDGEADPAAVFLFRHEAAGRLARLGLADLPPPQPQGYPIVYHLDLSDPAAFFLARSLRIEDKDLIYVADAPAAEFRQLVGTLVAPFLGSVQSAARATE